MRKIVFAFFLLLVCGQALANQRLEQRIYYYSRMSELLRNICFDPDGTYREHAVLSESGGSIRESTIDCDAQVLALDNERQAIEAEIQAAGGNCDVEISDPELVAFANGVSDIAQELQCPGVGSAGECVDGLARNLATSLSPLLAATSVARRITGQCGGASGGTNCLENLFAGAIFNLKDTGCGIASLFGYNCDAEPGAPDPEQVSSDAAVIASFQSNPDVVRFSEDPVAWMGQTASALFQQIGESIMERFGCAQWSNPCLPFASQCLRPLSWSCADCSTKANMVCGVIGYIGGEILVSFFTGAAVGIIARAASRIAIEAAVHFPQTTSVVVRATGRVVDTAAGAASLAARWAGRGGASIRNIWGAISTTRGGQILGTVASRIREGAAVVGRGGAALGRGTARFVVGAHDFARRRFFLFAASEDLALESVKTFNRLTEQAFTLGFRSTGQARSATINNFLGLYPRASDIRSGAYASQGIRTTDDYFRVVTQGLDPSARARLGIGVTRDGADSRVVLINLTESRAGVGTAYDFEGRAPAAATPTPPPPRRPEIIANPPPEIIPEPILVTGSRNFNDYPFIPASTRSQADVVRALGGDTAYNRTLATLSRDEYTLPGNFNSATYDLHDAWRAAHPELRATRPELFAELDELPLSQRNFYADELERAFRESNPDLVTSRGFQEYRASLRGEASAGITVGSAARVEGSAEAARAGVTPGDAAAAPAPVSGRRGAVAGEAADDPEEIIQRLSGNRYDIDDREITIDILLGGPKREEYMANRSGEFINRYEDLEREFEALDPAIRSRYQERFRRGAEEVVEGGNARAAQELEELGSESRITSRDIDCNAMNAVYPGSFPSRGGQCKRVRFDEDVAGVYCACGGMSKDTYNFLTRCPRSLEEFHSVFGFANGVALPSTSLPQACTRVTIPRGKECYFGSTSATYAGLGGLTQFLCLDDVSDRVRGVIAGQAEEARLSFGTPRIRPQRWSPFSDFPELQAIIQRASTACPDVCSIDAFRSLNRDYAAAIERIGRTTDPVQLARLAQERQSFELYMQSLRSGRLPTPNLSRAAGYTTAERRSAASSLLRRREPASVDGVAVPAVTPAQLDAIERAHQVGRAQGHGYFTFTDAEIAEKARILRESGLSRPEVRRLMRNGIVGGRADDVAVEFSEARGLAVRARDERSRLDRGGSSPEAVTGLFAESARGYAAEARRIRSPEITAEAWRLYARAGNPEAANEMIRLGLSQGMQRDRVISGLREQLRGVEEQLARGNNPALIVERDSLRAILRAGEGSSTGARPVAAAAGVTSAPRAPVAPGPSGARTAASVAPERDLTGRITDGLHEEWRRNFIAANGAEAVRNKPVPDSVLRAGETPESALARLEAAGVTGLSIEDGKLVQNINQPAEAILPELNQRLNGALAAEYAQLVSRGSIRTTQEIDRAAAEVHNIWMRNNEWQREAHPELFRPYNELTADEKLKDLDVLEQSLRARDPALANAPGLRQYRENLQRDLRREQELRRPATDYSPREAQNIANDYRLGRGGRPQSPQRAAEFYYRAGDGAIAGQFASVRAGRPTTYMRTPVGDAFRESLKGDGEIAMRILEDVRRSGGERYQMEALNAFIWENADTYNTYRLGTAVERENFRRLIQHIQENYGSSLYDPQRNYLRSWASKQSE